MRINKHGQVTIPPDIRRRLGLLPGTEVDLEARGECILLRRVPSAEARGERLIRAMAGKASSNLSTDEIMALTRGE